MTDREELNEFSIAQAAFLATYYMEEHHLARTGRVNRGKEK